MKWLILKEVTLYKRRTREATSAKTWEEQRGLAQTVQGWSSDHPVPRTGRQPLCQLTGYDLAEPAGVNGESNRAVMKSLSQLHAKGASKKQKLSVALLETPEHNSYCRSLYLGAHSTDHILMIISKHIGNTADRLAHQHCMVPFSLLPFLASDAGKKDTGDPYTQIDTHTRKCPEAQL